MVEKEKLEEQIGEVLGLEMAAQKAVEELSAKGLLEKREVKGKLQGMKKEAENHEKGLDKSCKDSQSQQVWISKA